MTAGNNRIIQGDCLKVMQEMDDKTFDYGFTSPPYNRLRNDKYQKYDDTINDYFKFLCDFTDQMKRLCKKAFFVNIQKTSYNKKQVLQYMGKYAEDIKEVFIWEKTNPMPASGKNITNAYEFFFYFADGSPKAKHTYTKNVIQSAVNSQMPKEHKAVMKQEISDWFISEFFDEGGSVIDPFFGLGTTGISCIKNKCTYTGIELVPEYCSLAEKRINNLQIELF